MDYFDYFLKNRNELDKKFITIFNELNKNVSKYNCDKPILTGKIQKYNNFLKGKNLSDKGKDCSQLMKEFSELFQRAVIWEHPGTMINITPPSNIVSIVAAAYASFYNPNFAQDESSGYLMTSELIVSKYLSEIVGWNFKKSRGIFTFGGKGTNMYAAKIGIKKAIPNCDQNGITDNVVIFSTERSHPCHSEICDWLGIGKNSCKKISVLKDGRIDISNLELQLRDCIENNIKIGCIILNGGTTNELIIDPIKEVVLLRDALVNEYNLSYVPHIHVDSVIGWVWLFFKKYDFSSNHLNMSNIEMLKIKSMQNKISEIKYADSFGADFHKTGFCPYVSSIFMAKDFSDVTSLGNKKNKETETMVFGEYSPFEYTLELTRSSLGPISAYIALELFGVEGFQKIIYSLFSNCEYIRDLLDQSQHFEVINKETEGIATLFVALPNEQKHYNDYISSSKDIINEYVEYNHQFYLFCLKMLDEGKVNFKITFSKSFKLFGSNYKTGALKIYPMSPIVDKKEIRSIIDEIINTKIEFDKNIKTNKIIEDRNLPMDYVYRD